MHLVKNCAKYILAIGIVLSLLSTTTFAVEVKSLYAATEPVASQSSADLTQAVKKALMQVFIKVSGNPQVSEIPVLQAKLNEAQSVLQQYNYLQMQLPDGTTTLALRAKFDPQAIKQWLTQANQAIWGVNRPLVLIWLAVPNIQASTVATTPATQTSTNTVNLIANDSNSVAQKLLEQDADNRGLPIMFPILDLRDLSDLSVNDIIQGNTSKVITASKRYGSDAVLVGSVSKNSNQQWQATWTLINNNQQTSWSVTGTDLNQVLQQGVNNVTNSLAATYAVYRDNENKQQVLLTVMNIHSLTDYAKVLAYLKQLTPVKRVEVVSLKPTEVIFRLNLIGGQAALVHAINLDHALKPIDVAETQNNPETSLYYQWAL